LSWHISAALTAAMPVARPRAARRTFEQHHPPLEHRDGGIAVAAVDIARCLVLEARFGRLGVRVAIAEVRNSASAVSPNALRSRPPRTSLVRGRQDFDLSCESLM
jgi:hypothetical protein